jgi:hypothetical protein
VSGGLAAITVVGAIAVAIGISLLDPGGDPPRASQAALALPAAPTTPDPTPGVTMVPTRSPAIFVAAEPSGDDGDGPSPLGTINDVPNADRLDFLFEFCTPPIPTTSGTQCQRDAHWVDPQNPNLGSGVWTAGRPFHVREGFINNREAPLGDGFNVVLYVTRLEASQDEPTYRYTSDFVLRGTSDRCGPTYEAQTGPEICEWFVHDFPKGLPEGRFAISAVWEAPCRAWIDLGLTGSCEDPGKVISLFSSEFDAPYRLSGPSYTEGSS